MLKSLKIRNFRNVLENEFQFHSKFTVICGDNGNGKSSILEAICLLGNNILTHNKPEDFVNIKKESFFIEGQFSDLQMSISYNKETKKKQYQVNSKKTSKPKYSEVGITVCVFSPSTMNLFSLGPSKRRDFLDQIIHSSFPNYKKILQHYEKVLKNRNALLRAIAEKKSTEKELEFWDDSFISAALEVYRYRYILVDFFKKNSAHLAKYFLEKTRNISFQYHSKLSFKTIEQELREYLFKNRQRDIILQKTYIGPHLDDFHIYIDSIELSKFASRGEIKSVILGLKLLEAQFIEDKTGKKPLFLLDDFKSELDETHSALLLDSLQEYQLISTNISPMDPEKHYHIYL